MIKRYFFYLSSLMLLLSCTNEPPKQIDNICKIFRDYPKWGKSAKDVSRRWKVPVWVQMAIIHQESKFDAYAKPARKKWFGIIPGPRPSTAYGYSQALNATWREYMRDAGYFFSSRNNFKDALDFIGWYSNQAYRRARVSRQDAYALYLAYHEGIGGYQQASYRKKPWLINVAKKVRQRAVIYRAQLSQCSRFR